MRQSRYCVYTGRCGAFKKTMIETSEIFNIEELTQNVICPPKQVFKNKEFDFLFVDGGHLVNDNAQYEEFMFLLKELGEESFVLKENLGATITERLKPHSLEFSVNSTLEEFNKKIKEVVDEHFGMAILHWFVHGNRNDWGIYIAEYPTINIFGCKTELSQKFRDVFKIESNGYNQQKELLDIEFKHSQNQNIKLEFNSNYGIKTHHNNA